MWDLLEIPNEIATPKQNSGTSGSSHFGESRNDSTPAAEGPGTVASPMRKKVQTKKAKKTQKREISKLDKALLGIPRSPVRGRG